MSNTAVERLMRDLNKLQKDAPPGISGGPSDDDIMLWNAIIVGLGGTLFEGGIFKLTLKFTEEYPVKPPVVQFVSRIFHPNIFGDGSICLDMLDLKWNPDYDAITILATIQLILGDPNPYSPANEQAATMLIERRLDYYKRVQRIVELSWKAI